MKSIQTLLDIRNPVILSAGILGDSVTKLKSAYDGGAGAVVTKSITIKPRDNRPEPTIIPLETGGWLNAVGLSNPGAEQFSHDLKNISFPVIVSLAGTAPLEFKEMIEQFKDVAAFEINLSCPNIDGFDIGNDPKLVYNIVSMAKSTTDKPIFVKIGHHMLEAAKQAINAGIDGITAINTIPATSINIKTGKPFFGPNTGGLSGKPIKPIALRTIHDLSSRHCTTPIIGCGGISTWQDAVEFLISGASAIQVGSAVMLTDNYSMLGKIADGIEKWRFDNNIDYIN